MHLLRRVALVVGLSLLARGTYGRPSEKPDPQPAVTVASQPGMTHGKGKPLSETTRRGLGWLAKHQLRGGGWGQGDESPSMGHSLDDQRDRANVADTAMAVLAFLRAGSTARVGEFQDSVQHGIEYVLGQVEASDDSSLKVTEVSGTRVQMKIGQFVDTFAALVMLDEARGAMRDGIANARVDAAIKKIVKKIERNQKNDGGWEGHGWAPVLSQALAAKGLNRAAQSGTAVSQIVLDRVEKQAQAATAGKQFAADAAAGVELYSGAAAASTVEESYHTKRANVDSMKAKAAKAGRGKEVQSPDAPTPAEIAHAEADAKTSRKAADASQAKLAERLNDPHFVSGFGSNGGEEFLSYLLMSEALLAKGGSEWTKWDTRVAKLVTGVQNGDGSWTGHHCITGRTFCTAAALLLLMADRAPVQAAIAG
ncbi:MAG TPA: prenyltransferase/squalene oxidase repeat-containing protein [Kofleriaceae bacterium]|jgi:hypothetical protein|nr:prenyltransferase/squalene oxidase repeat-containing protein [Kofleriaceae bacterium]